MSEAPVEQQQQHHVSTTAATGFTRVRQLVDEFSNFQSANQLLALSLLIPRLSPLQLSYVQSIAGFYFDKLPYADGKRCDELKTQAIDSC